MSASASASPVPAGGGDVGFASWQGLPPQHQSHAFSGTYHSNETPRAQQQQQNQQQQPLYSGQWGFNQSAPAYPDVTSYQQPYFYQQTDPSIYNSPWPPTGQETSTSSLATTSANYSSGNVFAPQLQQQSTMPFFPTSQATVEQPQTENYESTGDGTYQSYPELDTPPQQHNYAAPQLQSRARRAMTNFYFEDASMHLKLQSLPILDSLATQLIQTIAKASFSEIHDMMRGTDSEESQAYTTLKNLFDQTRKVYSRETAFIDAIAIQMFQPSQQEIIRKANIATFVSSILGAHDVSFFHLNEFFLDTFVPLGHRLLKWQGAIYLELKTQTYISALINSDTNPEAMLDELFPADQDAHILTRHPDAPSLSPSEQDFVDRSRSRKSYLLAEPATDDALRDLPKKYQWNDFVREFAACINKNVEGILNVPLRAHNIFGGAPHPRRLPDATSSVREALAGQQALIARDSSSNPNTTTTTATTRHGLPAVPSLPPQPTPSTGTSSNTDKKPSANTTTVRQPWTDAEQDALLAGLAKLSGPHWSQILALYGRGGSVSEVLKDRNQVQLKDKARNLKLWYLKMGREVPVALRGVTGELRKRGGARARAALGLLDGEEAGTAGGDAEGEEIGDGVEGDVKGGAGSGGKRKRGGGG